MKAVDVRTPGQIGPKVLERHPVWEFLNEDEHPKGDTAMRPVTRLPVTDLGGTVFGTTVTLADGTRCPAMIGDLDVRSKKYRHHFRSLTIFAKGKRFHLAKYFQAWYETKGPDGLARFLGKRKKDVFPIAYDLSALVKGPKDVVRGTFEVKVSDPIPRAKLMDIIITSVSPR